MIKAIDMSAGPDIAGVVLSTNGLLKLLDTIKAKLPSTPTDETIARLEFRANELIPDDLGAFVDEDHNVLYIFKLKVEPVEGA